MLSTRDADTLTVCSNHHAFTEKMLAKGCRQAHGMLIITCFHREDVINKGCRQAQDMLKITCFHKKVEMAKRVTAERKEMRTRS